MLFIGDKFYFQLQGHLLLPVCPSACMFAVLVTKAFSFLCRSVNGSVDHSQASYKRESCSIPGQSVLRLVMDKVTLGHVLLRVLLLLLCHCHSAITPCSFIHLSATLYELKESTALLNNTSKWNIEHCIDWKEVCHWWTRKDSQKSNCNVPAFTKTERGN